MTGVSTAAWKGAKELQRGQETTGCWSVLHMAWRDGCLLMHDKTSDVVHIKYMPHGPDVCVALTHLLGAIPYRGKSCRISHFPVLCKYL